MEKRPVLEKLLDALDATDLESKIFQHVVVKWSGTGNTNIMSEMEPILSVGRGTNAFQFNMTRVREMFADEGESATLANLMTIMDLESSKWIKEQLYLKLMPQVGFIVGLDENTLRVLMGLEITPAQYQKLGSSTLQKILLEDDVFQKSATGKAILNQKEMEEANEAMAKQVSGEQQSPSFFEHAMEAAGPPEDAQATKKDRIFGILSHVAQQEQKKPKEDTEELVATH